MNIKLEELLELQKELDEVVINNYEKRNDLHKNFCAQSDFLTEKLLALMVEVGELANETRSFKYWSTKEPSSKAVSLAEYADILHFVLSIANSLDFTADEIEQAYLKKHEENYKRQMEGY